MGNRVSNSIGQAAGQLTPIVAGIARGICGASQSEYADRATNVLLALAERGITLLALDFDMTMINCHTGGDWLGTPAELCALMRPLFAALVHAAAADGASVRLAVVTFSSQTEMIRAVLVELVGRRKADQFVVIGSDGTWDPATAVADAASAITLNGVPLDWLVNTHRCKGKIPWLCAAWAAMDWQVGPAQTVLVDDDCTNVELAARCGVSSVHFDCEGLSAEPRALAALEHLGVSRRLLFLGVDSVLTTESSDELSEELVRNLKWLVEHTGAELVITSAWRREDAKFRRLKSTLKTHQLPISNVTIHLPQDNRMDEIKAFIESLESLSSTPADHADSSWLTIDHIDLTELNPSLDESHFVKTCGTKGLVSAKAIEAAEKLMINAAMQIDKFVESGRLASIAAKRLKMAQQAR